MCFRKSKHQNQFIILSRIIISITFFMYAWYKYIMLTWVSTHLCAAMLLFVCTHVTEGPRLALESACSGLNSGSTSLLKSGLTVSASLASQLTLQTPMLSSEHSVTGKFPPRIYVKRSKLQYLSLHIPH